METSTAAPATQAAAMETIIAYLAICLFSGIGLSIFAALFSVVYVCIDPAFAVLLFLGIFLMLQWSDEDSSLRYLSLAGLLITSFSVLRFVLVPIYFSLSNAWVDHGDAIITVLDFIGRDIILRLASLIGSCRNGIMLIGVLALPIFVADSNDHVIPHRDPVSQRMPLRSKPSPKPQPMPRVTDGDVLAGSSISPAPVVPEMATTNLLLQTEPAPKLYRTPRRSLADIKRCKAERAGVLAGSSLSPNPVPEMVTKPAVSSRSWTTVPEVADHAEKSPSPPSPVGVCAGVLSTSSEIENHGLEMSTSYPPAVPTLEPSSTSRPGQDNDISPVQPLPLARVSPGMPVGDVPAAPEMLPSEQATGDAGEAMDIEPSGQGHDISAVQSEPSARVSPDMPMSDLPAEPEMLPSEPATGDAGDAMDVEPSCQDHGISAGQSQPSGDVLPDVPMNEAPAEPEMPPFGRATGEAMDVDLSHGSGQVGPSPVEQSGATAGALPGSMLWPTHGQGFAVQAMGTSPVGSAAQAAPSLASPPALVPLPASTAPPRRLAPMRGRPATTLPAPTATLPRTRQVTAAFNPGQKRGASPSDDGASETHLLTDDHSPSNARELATEPAYFDQKKLKTTTSNEEQGPQSTAADEAATAATDPDIKILDKTNPIMMETHWERPYRGHEFNEENSLPLADGVFNASQIASILKLWADFSARDYSLITSKIRRSASGVTNPACWVKELEVGRGLIAAVAPRAKSALDYARKNGRYWPAIKRNKRVVREIVASVEKLDHVLQEVIQGLGQSQGTVQRRETMAIRAHCHEFIEIATS